MLSYRDLSARWKRLRGEGTFTVREIACEGIARMLLCAENAAAAETCVAISAGVHGDEPAGVLALLALAENGELPQSAALRLWPCMNPSGFEAGTRESLEGTDINRTFARAGSSPEARAIIMATRDRKFTLSIDLHEDDTTPSFYAYEYGEAGIAAAAVAAVRAAGFPVESEAVLRPDAQLEQTAIGGMSYTLRLARGAAARAITFETPSALDLEHRIAIHRIAVKAALAAL